MNMNKVNNNISESSETVNKKIIRQCIHINFNNYIKNP